MTLQQALENALQNLRADKLGDAEGILRQIIALQPDQPDALYLLGLIAHQVGRDDKALEFLNRSIALRPEATVYYVNLASVLNGMNRLDEAEAAMRKALVICRDIPEALTGLSDILRKKKQFPQAVQAARDALGLRPNYAEAANNLGNALAEMGNNDEAISEFRNAIAAQPRYADAYYNLAASFQNKGDIPAAIAAFQQALTFNPNHAPACNGLGLAFKLQGNLPEAEAALFHAVSVKPDFDMAWFNFASLLADEGKWDQSIAAYGRALQLNPKLEIAYNNMGIALRSVYRLKDAIDIYRKGIEVNPNIPEIYTNLGNACLDDGQIDLALQSFDRAFALRPEFPYAHSNRIFILHFHPDFDAEAIFREASRWNDLHARPLAHLIRPHNNDRSPGRRLRVGYVSPHFYAQAESFFLIPLIREHDRTQVEVFCYSSVQVPDKLTHLARSVADVWQDVRLMKDAELAEQIRKDRIDILIDPTMHMSDHRLLVFARKPAPVQVTWLAYPGTTGLTAIDYRLTDPFIDPPGLFDRWYSEESIRLPQTWACFDPIYDTPSRPPRTPGPITFGSLNNPSKMNLSNIQLWARVMQAAADSRLLILSPTPEFEQRTRQAFGQSGIDQHRLEFVQRSHRLGYLRLHDRIDIALDPLPYNGITTTNDALWMGVPVVTLIGHRAAGRAAYSILANVGLNELAAQTPDEFVRIATNLASDLPHLQTYHATLRDRFLKSPIADRRGFARNVEVAYRQMWQRWCASGS